MVNKPKNSMSPAERAKQFMPFAAVKGLNAALHRKEQEMGLVSPKLLADEAAAELDAKLRQLQKGSLVAVTYFVNGQYLQNSGQILVLDKIHRCLLLSGVRPLQIAFDDIIDIKSAID